MRWRLRLGGVLLVIAVPALTDEQRRTIAAAGLSVAVNLILIALMMLILKRAPLTEGSPLAEKIVALNLKQDEDIKKALALFENPKANRVRPKDAKILSTENSVTPQKDVPDDLKNSRNVAVIENRGTTKTEEHNAKTNETSEEDQFDNTKTVFPFLKDPGGKSVKELITGEKEGTATLAGPLYELNTYKWDFAPYMLKWKDKMTNKWYQITSRLFFSPFAKLGSLEVYVKMNRQGQLLDSKVVQYDCDKAFVAPAYASIVNSFPLDPLPEKFPDDFLETTWTITINN